MTSSSKASTHVHRKNAEALGKRINRIEGQVRGIGRLAVDSAIKLAAGETLPAEQLLPGFLTTPENAAQFVAEHP